MYERIESILLLRYAREKHGAKGYYHLIGTEEDFKSQRNKYLYLNQNIIKLHSEKEEFSEEEMNELIEFHNTQPMPIFPLTGSDLIEIGFKGKEIGEKLDECKRIWLDENCSLTKEEFLYALTIGLI